MTSVLLPSPEEINIFFGQLANNEHPVALLSTAAEYTGFFERASCSEPNLPFLLSSLFKPEYCELSPHDLHKKCEEIFNSLKVSTSEALYLEQITRKQSGCLEWFDHRIGRITASVTYAVVGTNPDNPSTSLVEKICSTTYNSHALAPALMWGKQREGDARKAYEELHSKHHHDSHYRLSGLVINPIYPDLGASPDGRVDCACCGSGVIEIKSPYKYRHIKIEEINDPTFYLLKTATGLKLNPNHEYFYQVQMQMAICNVKYCDFVVWTLQGIVAIRIGVYPQFIEAVRPKLDKFFVQCILPNLLVPRKSSDQSLAMDVNPSQSTDNSAVAINQLEVFCYCQQAEDERPMIGCDNPKCPYQWFHFECLGLLEEPSTDTWYCPDCSIRFPISNEQ